MQRSISFETVQYSFIDNLIHRKDAKFAKKNIDTDN